MLGRQVEAWNKPGFDARWLDPCTLRNEVLPHFIAVQVVGNSPDPCPRRWGLVRGDRDRVPVPDSALVLPQRPCGEIPHGGNLEELMLRYGPRLNARRQAAVEEIKAEIAAVGAAGEGARHPTYMRAAARIAGICEHWCIPLDRPRQLLEQAYLETLTPDEARRRDRGSTRGVWSWLARRSA
jgi:hypothetical protein